MNECVNVCMCNVYVALKWTARMYSYHLVIHHDPDEDNVLTLYEWMNANHTGKTKLKQHECAAHTVY